MLTPVQQRAILYNLPNLVADLDVFDVMDHLIATTPSCLTPTDYETITTTAQQKGRAAGVRSLVTCLLRRPLDSPVFAAFCSALREQYGHLADLLESSLQQQPQPQTSINVESPVVDSKNHPVTSKPLDKSRSLETPCQNWSDFSILLSLSSLGFSNAVCGKCDVCFPHVTC
ncbi:unnamed protein product [Echinostoma caproni]|uniref:CARD_2 domain-containing protein n=1 Tax=Echinostoma caproni TaxID=27848 RepID=A0A183BDX6_9TREM|nr:unnamed protein product [Echinostoma caproni]